MKGTFKRAVATTLCLCLALALSACGDKGGDTSSQPSSSEGSGVVYETVEVTTPDLVRTAVMQCIAQNDIDTLEYVLSAKSGTYNSWRSAEFTACELIETLDNHNDEATGFYKIKITVAQKGSSPFAEGESIYYLETAMDDGEGHLMATLCPEEDYIPKETIYSNPAAALICELRDSGISEFGSPQSVDRDAMLSFLTAKAINLFYGGDLSEGVTQAQLNEMADRCFGLEEFDGTDLAGYDAEAEVYFMLGAGRKPAGNFRIASIVQLNLSTYTVVVEEFSDPMKTAVSREIRYTSKKNGDYFTVISGIEI